MECQKDFVKIKNSNSKLEIVVALDASEYGIRAVIFHKFEDGITKPVAHASRILSGCNFFLP